MEKNSKFKKDLCQDKRILNTKGGGQNKILTFRYFFIENILLFGFIIMLLVAGFTLENFFSVGNIKNILFHMSVTGILSIGMIYVMLFGEIDLSVGYLMVFVFFLSIKLQIWFGNLMGIKILSQGTQIFIGSQLLLGIIGVVLATIFGLINGVVIVYGKVKSFIMTLGMMSIFNGLSFIMSKGKSIFLTKSPEYSKLGVLSFGIFPLMSVVLIILVVVSAVLFKFHITGKRIYAIGANRAVAELAGINIKPWIIGAFVVSGFCAGLAGLFFSSRNSVVDPTQGDIYAITAIAIAVLGGTTIEGGEGNPFKVLVAALFLGTLLNILIIKGVSGAIQTIIVGITILIGFMLNKIVKVRREFSELEQ
ncbi:Ribose import permease protein RbsC [subsurface metagenome]